MSPPRRVTVVGAGFRFTSGISYYTCRVANALAERGAVSALLMRQLIPAVLYPGRRRVGVPVHDLRYDPAVAVHDGLDWSWWRTLPAALRFLRRQAPDLLVLQWWTGAVLHSYALLAWYARRRGARVLLEWHEVQDTGELRIPGARRYVQTVMGLLLRNVDGHVVHSDFDRRELARHYPIAAAPTALAPHGPYDHHRPAPRPQAADDGIITLLYFGVIRPYKGVEDLVAAFERLDAPVADRLRLVIVGETWEGWTAPLTAVERSPRRDRITVVNRYVTDAEVAGHFAAADVVALPYRRSSASGPLHVAMAAGLPVVVSDVGGLREAAEGYAGAVFAPPADPDALAAAICRALPLAGGRFADPRSWTEVVDAYHRLFAEVTGDRAKPAAA
ncbi:glycosyltransferase [Pilimelia columellifera]|uniref:Glycosyltransferase n=1 Tax=Pilimelia columellifera subsp. columellifera TaxID=706583 RepID=A0ABN3N4R4_9ACTN